MSEEYYEATLGHPCASCKCLELDDAQLGGKVEVDSSGISRVSFGDAPKTIGRHLNDYYRPADGDDYVVIPNGRVLTLGYHREDMFPNLPSLEKTASQGCEFCAMLRQDLLSVWLKREELADVRARIEDESDRPTDNGKILIHEIKCQYRYFAWSNGGERGLPWLDTFTVFFRVFDGWKFREGSLSYNVSTDSSDKCAGWLGIWRRPVTPDALPSQRLNCLLEKAIRRVPPSAENLYLPTRLIDVGMRTQPTLRLVVPKDDRAFLETVDPAAKRYIALSYCWGSREDAEKQLKTTGDTLDEHLEHLQYERLPRTIADAVELCRALHIRYLWVDALCIIQSHAEDWTRESFEMANVYANSLCTVCVLRGSSCVDGFLQPRKVRPRLAVRFRSALDASVSGKFYLSQPKAAHDDFEYDFQSGHHTLYHPASWDMEDSAWTERGWAFQEEQLSTRRTFVGDRMFHVSCSGFHESEDGSRFEYHSLLSSLLSRLTGPNPDNIFVSWYDWVGVYTSRHLTVAGDKLPALSALARTVAELCPGQRYLAGLWEADLQRGLLWTVERRNRSKDYMQDRKNEYIAPSWSWACDSIIPTRIVGSDDSRYPYTRKFELRDAKLETDPGNPFGRVSAGYILLNAKLFRVPLDANGKPNIIPKPEGGGYAQLYMQFDLTLLSQEDEYIADFRFDCDYPGGKHVDGCSKESIDQLWMICISSAQLALNYGNVRDDEIMFGLLLVPNENGDGFLKVGLFYTEARGLGGKKLGENVQPCEVKLV